MTSHIVVGVDGSEASRQALRWAAREARWRGAELDVVFAWQVPRSIAIAADELPPQTELEAAARRTAADLLEDELADTGDLTLNPIIAEGPPAEVLLEAARGAELLVVGSRGMGAFTGMLLGSVSQHCATHAPCPVAIIRTPAP